MKIAMEQFQQQFLRLYASDTSQYTPFALWKVQKMTAEGEAFYLADYDCYYVIRHKQLLFYTSVDKKCHIPAEQLNTLDMIVMNAAIFDTVKDQLEGFNNSYCWTLYYDFNCQVTLNPLKQYEVVDFDFTDDRHFQSAADIINGDADGGLHSLRIKKWTTIPSFDPSLWFFIRDTTNQKLISIGISTFHKEVKETDLDWIFVLPAYQGKGVGRFLIDEIIRRSAYRSSVIRVGGVDEFYKKCGFFEKECWGWAIKPGFGLNEQ
jgi:GNAT superfamily N-acetyltransferase